jgi:tetratricopeptide (TPR) repeat protein
MRNNNNATDNIFDPDNTGKRISPSKLRRRIRRELEVAAANKRDILAATEILMNAIALEDNLLRMTINVMTPVRTVHQALNSLWDTKALTYDIFPDSGAKHLELLDQLLAELPDRHDIEAKINGVIAEREQLTSELKSLLNTGHLLAVMHKAANSRWSEYDAIKTIVFNAQERFLNENDVMFAQIPELISAKRNYELDSLLTELETCGDTNTGLSEISKDNDAIVARAKKLYEHAIEHNLANKLPSAARTLGKLLCLCPDYPGAVPLLENVRGQIAQQLKIVENAKEQIYNRRYRRAIRLLRPFAAKNNSDEVKTLIAEAVKGNRNAFRRNLAIAAVIVAASVLAGVILANEYFQYKTFNSYRKKANAALQVKDYAKAVDFFNKALTVPGYDNNDCVKKMREQAKTNLCRKIPDTGMEFVWVKALDCWVGKYEVTNEEYRKFKPKHDSKSFGKHSLNSDRQPAVYVNFDDAGEYAKWLNQREQKANRIPPGYRYRLPTRQEWTAFSQCGDDRIYPWGDSMPPKYGNYSGQESASDNKIDGYNDSFPVTCPVEHSGRNEWGVYGVGGNVWECTVKSASDLSFDAWRGASWSYSIADCLTCTAPGVSSPSYRIHGFGFRLVLGH